MREAGEYAVRGGIVDLFPPGFEEPVRVDLFGDEVEKIRNFDPMSQRTTGERERLSLQSMVEFTLDEPSIARFRTGIERGQVHVHRSRSVEAAASFPDDSLDWVYIDGDHTYEAVRADLAAYYRTIRPGGYGIWAARNRAPWFLAATPTR